MTNRLSTAANKLRAASASPLLKGVAAFGGAELANRIVRLITTVVIARQLAPEIVGQAALTLTLFEMVRVLAGIGVGQRIIACGEGELAATCNAAHRLFWLWSAVLVGVQCCVALVLGMVFGQALAGWMLAVLALVYLMMPGGLVQVHLAMREGFNARLARTSASQAIADHLLTAALLLAWPSPWSVVLPKLLTAPIWLVMSRRNRPWRPDRAAGFAPAGDLVRFGGGVLAAEALNALRTQGDNLIIAATMGTSALGTYYFAFNAGLGIISSLVTAFGTVSFPLLCAAREGDKQAALRRVVKTGMALFLPVVAAQSLLAPFYVPIVFGSHWSFAAPLIAMLCLAGVAHLISTVTANWLRSQGRVGADARRSFVVCSAALGGLYAGTFTGSLRWAVVGLVAGQTIAAALFAIKALGPALFDQIKTFQLREKVA